MDGHAATQALATLAVRVGANVAPDQDVFVIAMDVGHAPLARAVAEAAYEAGARYVSVLYWDQHVKLAAHGTPRRTRSDSSPTGGSGSSPSAVSDPAR